MTETVTFTTWLRGPAQTVLDLKYTIDKSRQCSGTSGEGPTAACQLLLQKSSWHKTLTAGRDSSPEACAAKCRLRMAQAARNTLTHVVSSGTHLDCLTDQSSDERHRPSRVRLKFRCTRSNSEGDLRLDCRSVATMANISSAQMDRGTRQLQEMLHKAQVRLLPDMSPAMNTAATVCLLQLLC